MSVGVSVELRGRDGGHAELHDQEPAEPEVARALGHLRGEVVVRGKLDARHVDEHEVAAFGVGVLVVFRGGSEKEGLYGRVRLVGAWGLEFGIRFKE